LFKDHNAESNAINSGISLYLFENKLETASKIFVIKFPFFFKSSILIVSFFEIIILRSFDLFIV